MLNKLAAALLFLLALTPLSAAAGAPAGWDSGVGSSALVDPYAAGDEAASRARAKLKGGAKFVMVVAAEQQITQALVDGVAKHFPREIIHGGQATSPLTREGNFPEFGSLDIPAGVAVWALGGDADIAFAHTETKSPVVSTEDVYYEAGTLLAAELRRFIESSRRPGRLVVTWGDQYTGSNTSFVRGLNEGLGAPCPVAGAASGNVTAKEIIAGEIVTGVNAALAVAGDFRLGQSMGGGAHAPATAGRIVGEAVAAGGGGEPFFALVFNCRRRRRIMIDSGELAEELEAVNARLPGVDYFGYYGPGEVGSAATGEPAQGMGFTVSATAFFPVE